MLQSFTRDLFRRFSNEVGGVHGGIMQGFVAQGMARVMTVDAQAVAAALVRPTLASDGRCVSIVAAAVPTDLQRLHVGLALLDDIEREHHTDGRFLQAVCRSGLPSNRFWAAAGFTAIGTRTTTAARGKPLIIWRRCIGRPLDDWWRYIAPRKPRGPGGRWTKESEPEAAEVVAIDIDSITAVLIDNGFSNEEAARLARPGVWPDGMLIA